MDYVAYGMDLPIGSQTGSPGLAGTRDGNQNNLRISLDYVLNWCIFHYQATNSTKESTMSLPKEMIAASDRMNETNDCAVKAVAIATRISYERVHAVFKKAGRADGQGVSVSRIKVALMNLGFKAKKLESWKGKTAKTLDLPRGGDYIALTRNHALAVKFGLVKDWTSERRHRVIEVWEIVERF